MSTNYATEAEVLAFKVGGSTVDLSAYDAAEIEAEICLAEELIECITNNRFY